ncbi:MAG TPA: triple tyrosine motif-containing protein, partial [Gemmatimonadales bacterium]|nr:triple tyrosine motif-containing protein [Gemmatimonadales bacterium]
MWSIRDGAPSAALALAQSVDGVLWIGTATGLYRFDGVRFEPFQAPDSQPLPSLAIDELLALPDGTLWIGYNSGGVSMLAGGVLVNYGRQDGLPEGTVTAVARDSAGVVWAATTTGLARLHGQRWERVGAERGYPSGMTRDLLVDRRGTLWAAANAGVYVLQRDSTKFVRQAPSLDPEGSGFGVPREAPDGSIWGASTTLGLTRLSDSLGRPVPPRAAVGDLKAGWDLTFDRHGNAWMNSPLGLVRISHGGLKNQGAPSRHRPGHSRVEPIPGTQPLSGSMLEDREGNLWLPTQSGIERFRETKLTRVLLPPSTEGLSIAPADSEGVWLGRFRAGLLLARDAAILQPGGPLDITSAYRDPRGGVWFGGPRGLWHLPAGTSPSRPRFTPIPLPTAAGPGEVQAIALAPEGELWVSIRGARRKGVFRRRGEDWSLARQPPEFSNQIALSAAADSTGRVWLGYVGNRLVLVAQDSTHVYSTGDGLEVGNVTALVVRGRGLWIGGEGGVILFSDGRFRSLAATEPLRGISGIVERHNGDLWVNGAGGVTHIDAAEVRRALEDPAYRARAERFDYHDGLDGQAAQVRPLPTAVQGADGRLWFATETSVSWLDPTNIKRNRLPPPVQIRSVSAAGTAYRVGTRITLPARTTQLQVTYAALSLSIPDRVTFRYRLSGVDTSWTNAGTRREAYYTNLGPGSYRFQVIAANEDGVWNNTGASVDLEIRPTFTQTKAFILLIASVLAGAVWLLARWRRRQLTRALRAQYEGQLAERARVARELHDTLLGGMAGVAMQLNAASRRVAASDGDTAAV